MELNFKYRDRIITLNGVKVAQVNYDRGKCMPIFLNNPEMIYNSLPQPDDTNLYQVIDHIEGAFRAYLYSIIKEKARSRRRS